MNQGHAEQLRTIVRLDDLAPLDLVIDDASHQYELTRRSFNTLFALLRPGGHYVIEDWNWDHSPFQQDPNHPITLLQSPERLVTEVLHAMASVRQVVASVTIYRNLAAVRRGPADLEDGFDIRSLITPKMRPSRRLRLRHARTRLKSAAKRASRWAR